MQIKECRYRNIYSRRSIRSVYQSEATNPNDVINMIHAHLVLGQQSEYSVIFKKCKWEAQIKKKFNPALKEYILYVSRSVK